MSGCRPESQRKDCRTLPAGDYSIEGFEDSATAEGKNLKDFVSIVICSRRWFFNELRCPEDYEAACAVVESDREF